MPEDTVAELMEQEELTPLDLPHNGRGEEGPAQEEAQDPQARVAELEKTVAALTRALEQREAVLQEVRQTLEERERRSQETRRALKERDAEAERLQRELGVALERYRGALLQAALEVPPELVAGATVYEMEASLERARGLVERVRSQVEARLSAERVPPGAPARSAPDLSRLSPVEKIRQALKR